MCSPGEARGHEKKTKPETNHRTIAEVYGKTSKQKRERKRFAVLKLVYRYSTMRKAATWQAHVLQRLNIGNCL